MASTSMVVRTLFKAQDRLSKVFTTLSRKVGTFEDRATKAFRKASRAGSRFGSVMKGMLGAQLITRGLGLLTRGLGEVTRQFISMDDAIFGAVARFGDINLLTAEGREKMEALRRTARDVGATTKFTATQAAQGLEFMAQAGFTAEQAMASLAGVTRFATVGNLDLERATDIVTRSLGAFGLKAKETAQLTKNLDRFIDVMAVTTASTQATLEELFETTKFGANKLTQAGQSIETFGAIVGVLADKGIAASMAGTIVRRVMASLSDDVSRSKLAGLGVMVADADGNFRDLVDILEDLDKALVQVGGTVDVAGRVGDIFGIRGQTGVEALVAEIELMRERRQILEDSAGKAKEMSDIIEQSLGNRIKALISATLELGFQFFSAFEEKGRSGLQKIIDTIRTFDMKPIIEEVKKLFTIFVQLKDAIFPLVSFAFPILVSTLSNLLSLLITLEPVLTPLIILWATFATVTKAAAIAQGLYTAATLFATTATTTFTAALFANPIGLIIIGIIALVAGIVWMANNMEKVGEIWDDVWGGIKKTFFTVISFIFKGVAGVVKVILKAMKFLGGFFDFNTSGIDAVLLNIDHIGNFLDKKGFGGVENDTSNVEEKVALSNQFDFNFKGRLDIVGAPDGSTFTSTSDATGQPPIDVNLLQLGTN